MTEPSRAIREQATCPAQRRLARAPLALGVGEAWRRRLGRTGEPGRPLNPPQAAQTAFAFQSAINDSIVVFTSSAPYSSRIS
jgi:hypothetical protein